MHPQKNTMRPSLPPSAAWPNWRRLATTQISVGIDEEGNPVLLHDRQRSTHLHGVGLTGTGKTFFLSHIVVSDIRRGAACLLIDPLGTAIGYVRRCLAADNLNAMRREYGPWPALNRLRRQRREEFYSRIVIVDLSEPNFEARFNPLEPVPHIMGTLELAQAFATSMQMLLRAPLDQMRQLLLNLVALACVVIDSRGTVADMVELCCMDSRNLQEYLRLLRRKRAKGQLRIPVRPDLIERYMSSFFATASGKERRELTASLLRALSLLLCDPICGRLLESPKSNFHPSQTMVEGRPMLIGAPLLNLGSQAAVLSMIWSQFIALAMRRDPADVIAGRVPQVHAVIDEMQLFWTQELAEQVPVLRNVGLGLTLLHQSLTQVPLHTPEGAAMIRSVRGNASTHVVFRVGYEDAELLAGPLLRPRGLMVKQMREEVSRSRSLQRSSSRSRSHSRTRGQNQAFTRALTRNQGLTRTQGKSLSDTDGEQTTETRGESTSRSHGRSRSQGTGRTRSRALSRGETTGGSASWTRSDSESQSLGQSQTDGSSWSRSESTGTALAIAEGHGGRAPALRQNLSQGINHSHGGSASHSVSESLSRARGWGETEAVSGSNTRSSTQSSGMTESTTSGESESHGISKSTSKACGKSHSRTVAQSESLATSQSWGTTDSRSQGMSTSVAEGLTQGESEGLSVGESRREVTELYSIEEERTLGAYTLCSLPSREAYVVQRGAGEPKAVRMRTVDMDVTPLTRLGPLNGLADLRRLTALPPAEPAPSLGLLERLRASLGITGPDPEEE